MGTFYCQAGNEVRGKMDVPRAEKEARRDVIFIIALMRAKMDGGLGRCGGSGKARGINSEESCRSVAASLSPLSALF